MQYTLPCIVVSTDRPPPQYVSIAKQSLIGSWQCENLFGLHNPHSTVKQLHKPIHIEIPKASIIAEWVSRVEMLQIAGVQVPYFFTT
jgi:hypothetical protein